MIDKPKVKDVARNHWKAVLGQLGIDKSFLTGKHGPCPMCEGTDRWRFDDKDGEGTWFCSHCGAGDGIKLVMLHLGVEFKSAATVVEGLLPGAVRNPPKPTRDEESDRRAMNEVWRSGRPLDLNSVAGRYLNARTGMDTFCPDLRAATSLKHYVLDSRIPTTHPGLLALVRAPDGKPVNVHRTYLDPQGGKAKVEPPRKTMRGGEIAKGAAIRLVPLDDIGDIIGIAEGIETALSAAVLHSVPTWAAVTALGLEQWVPPHGKRVVIFGDNDPSYTGHAASYALAKRLVRDKITADVLIPTRLGADWNHVHAQQLAQPKGQAA